MRVTHTVGEPRRSKYQNFDLMGTKNQAWASIPIKDSQAETKSLGKAMYTSQGGQVRSFAPKLLVNRDQEWVNIPSMKRQGQGKIHAKSLASHTQNDKPYLVKKKFVCYDKPSLNIVKKE